ncbi:unnamed protein product, partial [Polarella glacialis]
ATKMSTSGDLSLVVSSGQPGTGGLKGTPVLISVQPPPGTGRTPSDICCVIDVSWSMTMEASVKAASGTTESNGLSMLDIAKHAVRTVISILGPEDRLCLVQFSRESSTVLPLTAMDAAGKAMAEDKLAKMTFGNGTDLWGGIAKGLDELQNNRSEARLCHTLLLTDGETENAGTVMTNLEAAKESYGGSLPGSIYTFGFGYEIDSKLLVKIAGFSDGAYGFIPDAGFVGTIFVNAVSTLLATVSCDAFLTIKDPASVVEVLGGWERCGKDGDTINLGTLQYGQSKDVVVIVSSEADPPVIAASLAYSSLGGKHIVQASCSKAADKAEVEVHFLRSRSVDTLRKISETAEVSSVDWGKALLRTLAEEVSASSVSEQEKVKGLLEDILGQCCEALDQKQSWERWGRHYLPSVMFAHQLQQCNNFKDPGVQFYGGELFADIRDVA